MSAMEFFKYGACALTLTALTIVGAFWLLMVA